MTAKFQPQRTVRDIPRDSRHNACREVELRLREANCRLQACIADLEARVKRLSP